MGAKQTLRLYYHKPYETDFTARIVEFKEHDGQRHVALDQTLFYPEGGGQPCDSGTLNGLPVNYVYEESGIVFHAVQGNIAAGESVHGAVDWERRFDHMQQHSGQHMVSQAFDRLFRARTIGFHLGSHLVTIDIDKDVTDREHLRHVEDVVNRAVYANRPVTVDEYHDGDKTVPALRKPPPKQDALRIVTIKDFDRIACCGTHVRYTGEVGLVKIVKAERYKGGARIHFLCGMRALRFTEEVTDIVQDISNHFNTAYTDLSAKITGMELENRECKKRLKSSESRMVDYVIKDCLAAAGSGVKGIRVISVFDEEFSAGAMRLLVQKAIKEAGVVVVAGTCDNAGCHVLMGRSQDADVSIKEPFQALLNAVDGKGGGSDTLMQGRGSKKGQIKGLFQQAADTLRRSL